MYRRLKNLIVIIFLSTLLIQCSFNKDAPTESGNNSSDKTAATLPKPADNSTNQSLNLTLDWNGGIAIKYDVYFGKNNPPAELILKDIDTKPVIKTNLSFNTTYYWRVISKFNDGSLVEGPVWSFTTLDSNTTIPGTGYALFLDSLATASPNVVKALFQVKDLNGNGITNLVSTDFEVYEDSQPISISESELQIKRDSGVPYTIKTVLMLDNSTSLKSQIDSIRSAAITFINNIIPNQEVAIYQFSEDIELLTDFTSDKNLLNAALQQYNLGYASTNLYGAVIKGASIWDDLYSPDNILQGSMILFTDGSDTQSSSSLASALNAVNNKIVFTIGLGNEIQPDILKQIGTRGNYSISDVSQLVAKFGNIQQQISDYSNSFYLLTYKSPKRGNADHYLTVRIKNNPHTGQNSFITGTFNSSGFSSK